MKEVDYFIKFNSQSEFENFCWLAKDLGYDKWYRMNFWRDPDIIYKHKADNGNIIALTKDKRIGTVSNYVLEYEYKYENLTIYSYDSFINLFKNKETTMSNLVGKWKEIGLKEPKKTFRKIGITGNDDMPTEEGVRIFVAWLLADKEMGNKFYNDVAKPIREEEEKNEEE